MRYLYMGIPTHRNRRNCKCSAEPHALTLWHGATESNLSTHTEILLVTLRFRAGADRDAIECCMFSAPLL
jgi:hypothetical protein